MYTGGMRGMLAMYTRGIWEVIPPWVYVHPTHPRVYHGHTLHPAGLRSTDEVLRLAGERALGSDPRLITDMRRIEALVLPKVLRLLGSSAQSASLSPATLITTIG